MENVGWELRSSVAVSREFSSRIDVLQKCANPGCRAQFRYLHQGKLFEVEMQYFDSPSGDNRGKLGSGKAQIERCWLCDHCAAYIVLRFDRRRGVIMVSSAGHSEEKLTLQLNGRTASEIERVLIRPLDWDLTAQNWRKAVGRSRARREKIA